MKVAVLLTCYNRREKTITCLKSFYEASLPHSYEFTVFLVDDDSSDGTGEIVKQKFPEVIVIKGSGNLFWAGGMRLAWNTALAYNNFDLFLLINDDVELKKNFFNSLIQTENYSLKKTGERGIYSGATINIQNNNVSYGGHRIKNKLFSLKIETLSPAEIPQECDITNANILGVSKNVVETIGILDSNFTHGIADYDYSLRAKKKNLPVWLAPGICGYCTDDHGVNWKSSDVPLSERIKYLKSPKGLSYREYLFYIRRHFFIYLPFAFAKLWLKTLYPGIWEIFKPIKVS